MPMEKMMELIQQGQAPENTDIPAPDAAGAGPDASTYGFSYVYPRTKDGEQGSSKHQYPNGDGLT